VLAACAAFLYRSFVSNADRRVTAQQSQSEPSRSPNSKERTPANQAQKATAKPPVPVVSTPAQVEDFTIRRRTIGNFETPAAVTIRARVDSQVLQQHVRDGQLVKNGDLLFTLDDRELRAALARDQAQLAKDQAELARTQLDVRRVQELVRRDAAP